MRSTTKAWGAVLVGVGWAACNTGEAAEEAPALATAEVVRGDLTIRAEATGTVEPIRSVEVKSKASGEILKLHADIGDAVRPGALLAEVDPRDVRNRFDQTEADLQVARARVEISEAQLARSTELLEAGVITQQEHESARLDYANAQANMVKADTNFELSELQLEDVTIRAPMNGTILSKSVEEGQVIQSASQNVSGGTTLFVMANLSEMQVRTLVDETDMGELRAGMTASVKVEAFPDRTFQGTVKKIEPQAVVQQNVTMFPVIVNLDNRAGLLKPGMNAEVEILIDEATDVLLIPNTAVVKTSDVGPAAMALGIDPETLDLRALMMAGGRDGPPARAGGDVTGDGPSGQGRSRGGRARLDSLRAKVESGEISQDSMRAVLAALRGRVGAARGATGAGQPADGAPPRESRAAVVFVIGADSLPEPRPIRIGLNDWDNTQVVTGLEQGETLAVVGAAQLLAQQQEWLNRIRERSGNLFGGGMSGRPRSGGRR